MGSRGKRILNMLNNEKSLENIDNVSYYSEPSTSNEYEHHSPSISKNEAKPTEVECQAADTTLINEALSSQFFILQSDGSLLQLEENRTEAEDCNKLLNDLSFSSNEIYDAAQSLINGNEIPDSTVEHSDSEMTKETVKDNFTIDQSSVPPEGSNLFSFTAKSRENDIIDEIVEENLSIFQNVIPQEESELFSVTVESGENEMIDKIVEENREVVTKIVVPQKLNENQQPHNPDVPAEKDGRIMLIDSHRSRRKRHMVKEDEWEYKRAKLLREKGKPYKGRKLVNGKNKFVVTKPPREMKDINCKCKSTKFCCKSLTNDQRTKMFNEFWEMSWEAKKVYIKGLIQVNLTRRARDRKEEGISRRKFSHEFYFNVENKKQRVCRRTFLATLNIGEWTVLNWIKDNNDSNFNSDDSNAEESDIEGHDITKSRSKRREVQTCNFKSKREELTERHNFMKEFFEKLPKVESHYCRASSKKLYLEPIWSSKAKLYEFYCQDWCKGKEKNPLSSCSFHKMFEELNLGLYRPKKDQCDLCTAYKKNNIGKEAYEEHMRKKDVARKSKENDKENEEHVYTTDLQSLLLCPKSNASALYYRSKLAVHNMTIFDLKTNDGYCYLWNESEGQLTANEFATILTDFIISQLPLRNHSKKVIIYSDGCNYQNRCATLANALMHLAKRHQIAIEQKYLERGHTQMECDSMHSIIERCIKNKDINIPVEYDTICKKARRNPRPYHVTYLDHTRFLDYTKAMPFKSIRPGVGVGQPKVTDIRCLLFTEDGKISYKLNYEDEYKLLPVFMPKNKISKNILSCATTSTRPKRKSTSKGTQSMERSLNSDVGETLIGIFDFPQLYSSRIKIPLSKYNHLQELKMILSSDYHAFYDNLPHD